MSAQPPADPVEPSADARAAELVESAGSARSAGSAGSAGSVETAGSAGSVETAGSAGGAASDLRQFGYEQELRRSSRSPRWSRARSRAPTFGLGIIGYVLTQADTNAKVGGVVWLAVGALVFVYFLLTGRSRELTIGEA